MAEILTKVHGIKVTTPRTLKKSMLGEQSVNEQDFQENFWHPSVQEMGMPERLDSDFQHSLEFVKAKLEKLKAN